MGGYGSSRWGCHTKKRTVEDGLSLDVGKLVRDGILNSSETYGGSLTWRSTRSGEVRGSVSFDRRRVGDELLFIVRYTVTRRNGEKVDVENRIPCETTPLHFGGVRWWFRCPSCGRRAGKLHLPPSALRFACRTCHDLAYTSSQEHDKKMDALAASIGKEVGYPGRLTPGGMTRILEGRGVKKQTAKAALAALR